MNVSDELKNNFITRGLFSSSSPNETWSRFWCVIQSFAYMLKKKEKKKRKEEKKVLLSDTSKTELNESSANSNQTSCIEILVNVS